ncbi:MAG: MFS transporter [Thaumarchaeota archaeon]|nr:MFS transporter [Nitrososphaerota archaeon]
MEKQRTQERTTLFVLSTIIFILYASQVQFRPIFPHYVELRGGGEAAVGLAIFLNWLAQAILAIPSGSLSDKIGRKATTIIGAAIAAAGLFFLPIASTVILIMLFYFIAGMGQGAYSTATAAYPVDLARSGQAGRAIGWSQVGRQSALSFGPAIGGILATFSDFNTVFLASALMAVAAVVLSWAKLPDLRPQKPAIKTKYSFIDALSNPIILGAVIATFSLQFSNSAFLSFLPLYARQLPFAIIGLIFTVHGLMNVVGRPVVGELSARISRKVFAISLGLGFGTSGMLILSLSSSFEVLIASAILVGLSTGIGIVLLLAIVAEQAPPEKRGFVIGFQNTAIYLGLGTGSAIEGIVIENFGYAIAFQSSALLTLTGLIVFAVLSSLKRLYGSKIS